MAHCPCEAQEDTKAPTEIVTRSRPSGRPSERQAKATCAVYKGKKGAQGPGVHLQLGTRLGRGGSLQREMDGCGLLKTDQKEASSWQMERGLMWKEEMKSPGQG